jgi:transposase
LAKNTLASLATAESVLLMDSTHIMSSSEHLSINACGYNPDFDFGKQLRLMYMFSAQLKKPVYYRLINGPDISSLSMCFKEMDVKNIVLVADKGFYSDKNIQFLDNQRLQYLIPLRRNHSDIDYNPLLQSDFKK